MKCFTFYKREDLKDKKLVGFVNVCLHWCWGRLFQFHVLAIELISSCLQIHFYRMRDTLIFIINKCSAREWIIMMFEKISKWSILCKSSLVKVKHRVKPYYYYCSILQCNSAAFWICSSVTQVSRTTTDSNQALTWLKLDSRKSVQLCQHWKCIEK